MASKKSLYEILNINKDATESEIRTAYKKLAKKYHPDMHANKTEEEKTQMQDKFKEICNAYEILTDKKKKEFYDHTGMTEEEATQGRGSYGASAGGFNFPGGGFNGFSGFSDGFNFAEFESMGGNGFHDFNDIGSIFGRGGFGAGGGLGGMFGERQRNREERKTSQKKPNLIFEYKMSASLEEICNGSERKIRIKRQAQTGEREEKLLNVKILPGYKYGTKITYNNAGDYHSDGTSTDVVIILTEKPHEHFKLSDNDIVYEIDITIKEYLNGFSKTVKGLTNNTITIDSKLIGDNSKQIVIEGEGIPDRRKGMKRGRLIVKPRIIMDLTPSEKRALSSALDN